MRWLSFERRWRDALLAAMLPRLRPDGLPGLAEVDARDFWPRFHAAAPPALRAGLRAAVWLLTFAPLFLAGRPRTFAALAPRDRDRLLRRAARHRSYVLRQAVLALKVVASFAYFEDERVRARFESAP